MAQALSYFEKRNKILITRYLKDLAGFENLLGLIKRISIYLTDFGLRTKDQLHLISSNKNTNDDDRYNHDCHRVRGGVYAEQYLDLLLLKCRLLIFQPLHPDFFLRLYKL